MPDHDDLPAPLLTLHRDIGRLEGRVGALEGAVSEIKNWLSTIAHQVSEIHGILSSDKGKASGERTVLTQVWKFVGWLTGLAMAAFTAWVTVRYSK
jgi:hypothetical protein